MLITDTQSETAQGTPRPGDAAAQPVKFDLALARAMSRLKMMSCKLDLATTHWKSACRG